MELTRTRTIDGLFAEYDDFAKLVSGVETTRWDAPTRCTGWQVRDVAAHVLGNITDTLDGTIGSRAPDDQARALRHHEPAAMAAALREAAARFRSGLDRLGDDAWEGESLVAGLTVGEGVLTLWYDTYVHGDDIRAALGQPPQRGPGLDAAVEYLELALKKRGQASARPASSDPLRFVLVATGRADPAELGLDEHVNIYA